jgi:multisite-specific tRNA:(cytosine-C5)-methyltransferase
MVTNLDASIYPVLQVPSPGGQKLEQLRFDRILCDVPCSGDGTIRKNIGIWKTWQPMDGNGLHALVLRSLSVSNEHNAS